MQQQSFYIGTSGIVVPIPQSEYPAKFKGKSRLAYYSSLLNSVEVNSTFYKLPRVTTINKWIEEVNDDFIFTFKIPKTISHVKGLQFEEADVASFFDLINNVTEQRGCLLLQLSPSATIELLPALVKLLKEIRCNNAANAWQLVVEFRHPSWYVTKVETTLSKYNSCIVIHDHPKAPTPLTIEGPFIYLRFHGEGGRYRGSYNTAQLQPYVSLAKERLAAGQTGYCYFNNTMGDACANAMKFQGMVKRNLSDS